MDPDFESDIGSTSPMISTAVSEPKINVRKYISALKWIPIVLSIVCLILFFITVGSFETGITTDCEKVDIDCNAEGTAEEAYIKWTYGCNDSFKREMKIMTNLGIALASATAIITICLRSIIKNNEQVFMTFILFVSYTFLGYWELSHKYNKNITRYLYPETKSGSYDTIIADMAGCAIISIALNILLILVAWA